MIKYAADKAWNHLCQSYAIHRKKNSLMDFLSLVTLIFCIVYFKLESLNVSNITKLTPVNKVMENGK